MLISYNEKEDILRIQLKDEGPQDVINVGNGISIELDINENPLALEIKNASRIQKPEELLKVKLLLF